MLDKRISLSFVACFLRLELSSYTGGVVAPLALADIRTRPCFDGHSRDHICKNTLYYANIDFDIPSNTKHGTFEIAINFPLHALRSETISRTVTDVRLPDVGSLLGDN